MSNPIQFVQLSFDDQAAVILKACEWYDNHHEYVDKLIDNATSCYPPSGYALIRPELWKDANWHWLWGKGELTL